MKRFYCASPIVFFIGGLCALIIVAGIYVIVAVLLDMISDNPWLKWGGLLSAIVVIVLMSIVIASLIWKRILFTQKSVSVRNDFQWRGFFRRLQHAVTISFSDVVGLLYVQTTNDSNGKKMNWVFVQMPYLVFVCKDGGEKAINLYYFSRGQRKRIVDEVICRVMQMGNQLNVTSAEDLMHNIIQR